MGKKSTLLKIVFFSLLLVGFIAIQYCWLSSLQKDKLRDFKSLLVLGINKEGGKIPSSRLAHELTDTAFGNILRRSFSSKGLKNIRFEFSISSGNNHLSSRGFHQKLINNPNNLVLYYLIQQNVEKGTSDDYLIVVVPSWKKIVWKEMAWFITASLFLMIMILFIFSAFLLGERRQQLFYNNRSNAIKNMMKHLETPLSTVSVAAEALQNDKVMHDSRKINYYQQIINEESKRMNEQVKKCMRDLE